MDLRVLSWTDQGVYGDGTPVYSSCESGGDGCDPGLFTGYTVGTGVVLK